MALRRCLFRSSSTPGLCAGPGAPGRGAGGARAREDQYDEWTNNAQWTPFATLALPIPAIPQFAPTHDPEMYIKCRNRKRCQRRMQCIWYIHSLMCHETLSRTLSMTPTAPRRGGCPTCSWPHPYLTLCPPLLLPPRLDGVVTDSPTQPLTPSPSPRCLVFLNT